MQLIDANVILRYILDDHEIMSKKAAEIINNGAVFVTPEVIAEVVYVLKGFYSVEKEMIKEAVLQILEEINASEKDVIISAINKFTEQNFDFVDCLLYVYKKERGYNIITFDKKLNRLLETLKN